MKVSVIIPTYDRLEKLKRTIKSILEGDYNKIHIFVVIDGNKEMHLNFPSLPVTVIRNEERMDWVFSINRALREMGDADAAIYAGDDLEFPPHSISRAMEAMKKHFPDGDGLVGLKQSCAGVDSAFGLMGRKFIERFPNRQVLCPDYIHYVSDREIGQFAKSINKFYFCKDVIIKHDRSKDKTRELALKILGTDKATKAERARKGFLWGRDFERIKQ